MTTNLPIVAAEPASAPTGELLRIQVQRVADARREFAAEALALAVEKQRWEATVEPLVTRAQAAKVRVAEEEARLRDLAVTEFKATGSTNKQPGPGVSIKDESVLTYDQEEAFAWAREKDMALMLDTAAFEAIAKATPLPFVTKTKVPTATIAKDLDKALAAGK